MSLPGIELGTGIVVGAPKALDSKYGPFEGATLAAAKTEALTNVTAGFRFEGLTIGLIVTGNPVVEYWFQSGIADANFVAKGGGAGSIDVEKDGVSVVTSNTVNFKGNFKVVNNSGTADISADTYIASFIAALSQWNINHNLDKYPSVSVVDTNDEIIIAGVTYTDRNNLTIDFKNNTAGKAYLT